MQDGTYGINVFITPEMIEALGEKEAWNYVRHDLNKQFFDMLEPIIGDEMHHVFYSEYLKDFDRSGGYYNYYLKIRHSIANVQPIYIASMIEIPKTAVKICHWCGDVLKLDRRGACAGCGGPPGEAYNE